MIITLFVVFILLILVLFRTRKYEVKYITSDIDNEKYLVRETEDKQQAANLLAKIRRNILMLSNYLENNKDKYKEYEKYINQLSERIKGVIVSESNEDSIYTSYSINKGEQIVFCLRSKKNGKLHDENLMMYVALHEYAHLSCPIYGHGDLFKKIFAFLSTIAVELGIYNKIDFGDNPVEYCGLTISESII
jgi:hypothetical protein